MKYHQIVLSKKTKSEIQKRLNTLTSSGIFGIHKAIRRSIIAVGTKRFRSREAWKEKEVTIMSERHSFKGTDMNPKGALALLRLIDEPETHSSIMFFYENDIFYFSKRSVRVQMSHKTFDDKFELLRICPLAKKPKYSKRALKFFDESEEARMDFMMSIPTW